MRPENGVGAGLSSDNLLLQARQQPFRFRQSQPRTGYIAEIAGAIDPHDVRGLPLARGAGFYQPQNPGHTSTPGQTMDAKTTLLAHTPPNLRQSP